MAQWNPEGKFDDQITVKCFAADLERWKTNLTADGNLARLIRQLLNQQLAQRGFELPPPSHLEPEDL